MTLRFPESFVHGLQRIGRTLGLVLAVWLLAAFAAMFLTDRYPALHPFVFWTFRIYLGAFIGAFVAGGVAVLIVAPGVYAAREAFDLVHVPQCSRLELYLTWAWASFAGLLLTAVLGTAAWAMVFGRLADVKLWFLGLCWLLLLLPWCLIGFIGRRLLSGRRPDSHRKSADGV